MQRPIRTGRDTAPNQHECPRRSRAQDRHFFERKRHPCLAGGIARLREIRVEPERKRSLHCAVQHTRVQNVPCRRFLHAVGQRHLRQYIGSAFAVLSETNASQDVIGRSVLDSGRAECGITS